MKAATKNLSRFIRLFRPHYRWMSLGALLGFVAVIASVGLLALSGWFISTAAFVGLTLSTAHLFNFFYPSIWVRIFAITRTLSRYAERLVTHDATFRMLATLRVWFYRKIEPLAPACLMRYRSADILSRIVADIEALDNLYVRVLSPSIIAAFTILAVVLFLSFFDPGIAATALLFLMVAGIAVPLMAGKVGAPAGRELTFHTSWMRIRVVEGIQGLSELAVFGAWKKQIDALDKQSRALISIQARMSQIRGLAIAATTLLTGLAVLACLYLAIDRLEKGVINGADLAMVAFAVLASFEAVLPLPWAYQYLGQTREAGRRLLELVETPPEVIFPKESNTDIQRFDIRFDNVDFRYGDSEPWVLKAFDLRIEQGRSLAILGETGAGKSSLFNLLVRFWDPINGSIRIGDQDIKNLSEPELRRAMGVVSQQSHLFNATIRRNLLLAKPDADETALKSALSKAQLLEFVDTLPKGLDTWIGEGGRALSGGQARRLSLARAFLQDAPIWVLDEPTEGLDRITEKKMMRSLFQSAKAHTMLLITHRTADLAQFDEIIMIDQGRIVARGDHATLLKTNDRYANLLQLST